MKLLITTLFLLPTLALADGYDIYALNESGVPSIRIQLSTDFDTTDGCNYFALSGGLRAAASENSLEQLLVADVAAVQTEMGCAPLNQPRHVHLVSKAFEIRAVSGHIFARVLVPHAFKLVRLP